MNFQLDFFMGALCPAGFTGFFPSLQQAGWKLYLLKAGPGCGKSTLMRKLADRADGTVERIHCSSDPASLDGVIFWKQHAAVLDATAPHALDPLYPGAGEQVISLYDALDSSMLTQSRGEIKALFRQCSTLQKRAAHYIQAAGILLEENRSMAAEALDHAKAQRYAGHLAHRELPACNRAGSEQLRFLSAVTLQGLTFYRDTVPKLARRIVVFHDESGAASGMILQQLRDAALAKGHQIITCRCPLAAEPRIEHLFVPALQLAFLTSNSRNPCRFEGQKNVRCSRFMNQDALQAHHRLMRFNSRAAGEMMARTSDLQRQAKHRHDLLEQQYRAASDFSRADADLEQIADHLEL